MIFRPYLAAYRAALASLWHRVVPSGTPPASPYAGLGPEAAPLHPGAWYTPGGSPVAPPYPLPPQALPGYTPPLN